MSQTIINPNRIEEIQKIEELINLASDVKLGVGTVTIDEMKRKEFKLKEKAVLEIHHHKISEIQIQDRKITRKKWQTRINSQRNIKKNRHHNGCHYKDGARQRFFRTRPEIIYARQ